MSEELEPAASKLIKEDFDVEKAKNDFTYFAEHVLGADPKDAKLAEKIIDSETKTLTMRRRARIKGGSRITEGNHE